MMMKTIFLFVCHVSMDPQNADRDREYGNRKTTFSARQVREVISKDKITEFLKTSIEHPIL